MPGRKALRGIHSCNFSKETFTNNPYRAAGCGFFDPRPSYFDTQIDWFCAAAHFLTCPINHRIHILHIYLRVNICKTGVGHYCGFCCNIASLHRNICQPPHGVPGCLCSLLVSVRPHWKHRNASVCGPSSDL